MTRILQRFGQHPRETCKCRDDTRSITVWTNPYTNLKYRDGVTRILQRFGKRPAQTVRAEMTHILQLFGKSQFLSCTEDTLKALVSKATVGIYHHYV